MTPKNLHFSFNLPLHGGHVKVKCLADEHTTHMVIPLLPN